MIQNDKNLDSIMNNDLKTFDYFVDDLLSSEVDLLINELDLVLMQYLFNSIDLELFNDINSPAEIIVA